MGTGRVHGDHVDRESIFFMETGRVLVHGDRETGRVLVCVCGGEGYLNNIDPVGHLLQSDF